jgi:hypothetical protein
MTVIADDTLTLIAALAPVLAMVAAMYVARLSAAPARTKICDDHHKMYRRYKIERRQHQPDTDRE